MIPMKDLIIRITCYFYFLTGDIMNAQTILQCLIPSVFCGSPHSPVPEPNLKENIRYTERGTPLTCMKKGVGVGRRIERQSHLPPHSLQNIKYIGEVYEANFVAKRVRNVPQLVKYIRAHSREQNGRFLREVLTDAVGRTDQRAMNSVLHFLYYENELIRSKLPVCHPL